MNDWRDQWRHLSSRMRRRKTISAHDHSTELRRCLTTCHLTFMGVGSTVGVGIYVLVGVAAKEYAGPGVLLSFLLAGVITMFNALSFAEFSARIPKTGALYTYVYESACELLAFNVGWISLVGHLTSGAIAARAWSGYLDSIFNNYIHNTVTDHIGNVTLGPPFSEQLDFMACGYELVVIIIISSGVHASAIISSVLAALSVAVLIFVSVMGLMYGDYSNITNTEHGGFLPFGIGGVLAGTAACFYAYQGFEIMCMSAEECKTPSKSISRAITWELLIVTVLYVGSSLGLILLVPYMDINTRSPLPSAFARRGIEWAKLVVSIGPTLGISNLNILNLYSLSRQVYCMASDSLFFRTFLVVHPKTQVPVRATVVLGLVVSVLALFLDISNLVSFNVIALFFGFIVANMILIISRKKQDPRAASGEGNIDNVERPSVDPSPDEEEQGNIDNVDRPSVDPSPDKEEQGNIDNVERPSVDPSPDEEEQGNIDNVDRPSVDPSPDEEEPKSWLQHSADFICLNNLLYLVIVTSMGLGVQVTKGIDDIYKGNVLACICIGLLVGLLVFLSVLISKKTGAAAHEGFSVPFVPYLPVLSIVVNVALLIAAVDVPGMVGYTILAVLGFGFYVCLVFCDRTTTSDEGKTTPCKTGEETALISQSQTNYNSR